jgi:hypothetical protein
MSPQHHAACLRGLATGHNGAEKRIVQRRRPQKSGTLVKFQLRKSVSSELNNVSLYHVCKQKLSRCGAAPHRQHVYPDLIIFLRQLVDLHFRGASRRPHWQARRMC